MISRNSRRAAGAALFLASATLLAACGNKAGAPGEAPGANSSAAIEAPPPVKAPPEEVLAMFAQPRKAEGPLRIKIVTNAVAPFWEPMQVGMQRQAKEMGVDASWSGPQKGTVPEQRRLLEDAVASGADGIALSAINAEALAPVIDELMKKANPPIPIITIDSDSPQSNRLAYIGTNNFEAGKRAGEAAVALLPEGGDVVAFVGVLGTDNATQRINGFKSVAGPKGINVISVMEDQSDKTKARKNVEDAINKYGDKVKGFLGVWSYNGPAIAAAVSSANKRDQYKVMCFDTEPTTIEALKKDQVDFTVVQDPYMFGVDAVKLLTLINRKGLPEAKKEMNLPDNYVVDTGVTIVTPKNLDEFLGKLKERGIQSS